MRAALLKLYANAQLKLATLRDQHEQNTAERALVFGLVAFAAIAGTGVFATRAYNALSHLAAVLATYIDSNR